MGKTTSRKKTNLDVRIDDAKGKETTFEEKRLLSEGKCTERHIQTTVFERV